VLIACKFCDLLHRSQQLRRGQKALCARCSGRLYGSDADSLERTLALTLTSLVLYVIANAALFMHVSLEGQAQSNRILSGVLDLAEFGYLSLAGLILFTTILAPLAKLLVTLYAIVPVMAGRRFPGVAIAMRAAEVLATWSMLEVYLLAVIVAVVKLAMMATVQLEVGAYAFFALILFSTAANAAFESEAVWSRLSAQR
jgi:paraquat-inducible protein A